MSQPPGAGGGPAQAAFELPPPPATPGLAEDISAGSDEGRQSVCRDAAWLGVELDEAANDAGGPRISREGGKVSAWVIPTDEELIMARHTSRLTAV